MTQQLKLTTEILPNSNFLNMSNFIAIDGPPMGHEWDVNGERSGPPIFNPRKDHGWAIDGGAKEPVGSQCG